MIVRNRTRDVVLADRTRVADRMLARMVGLLASRGLGEGEGLFITPCNSIHTWFMRFTIDAVFVDSDDRVVKTVERMRPWRMTAPAFKARAVLELPAGRISSTGTCVGDQLERAAA